MSRASAGLAVLLLVGSSYAQSGSPGAAKPVATAANPGAPVESDAIRPFKVSFPDEALADLRRRIAATRWPERETVNDDSQGVRLSTTQALARYWLENYDWRKVEARLNALPNFVTEIDGLD